MELSTGANTRISNTIKSTVGNKANNSTFSGKLHVCTDRYSLA